MTIYIKDMVCVRCKMAVRSVLEELGIAYQKIELGRAVLDRTLTREELVNLNKALKRFELELMSDRNKILTERIKTLILEAIRSPETESGLKLSAFISQHMAYDYTYLANLFSEIEGTTIERFYIENRIERAKELMIYDGLSTKEIAYRLNYSSMSHLCLQFKKVTGYTPADFKKRCQSDDFVWKTGN
ncbi:MAG TPA: AraC family transcriptional regulator [Flavisolibacter sp.]|nr:AraC family transcriptional regulator [Flavisolibacter sp.]